METSLCEYESTAEEINALHNFALIFRHVDIAINNISLKSRFRGLHFCCGKYWCIFHHFYVICPEFSEITLPLGLLCRSRSSKVTEFGTNRKLICDFLLVINTNLPPILHRFRYTAFDRSKIAILGYPSTVFNSPNGGIPLGRSL